MTGLEELNAFIRRATEDVRLGMAPDEDWAPAAFIFGEDGELHIVSTEGWTNDAEKLAYAQTVARMTVMYQATSVGLVGTVWMLVMIGEPDAVLVRPRDHPQRIETLMVLSMSAEDSVTAFAVIERHDNAPPTLREWDVSTGGELEGDISAPLQAALRKVKDG